MRNEALFDKIAAQIEETPGLYYQSSWISEKECGTAYCVAGWAAVLSGYSLSQESHRSYGYTTIVAKKDGRPHAGSIETLSARLLGIEYKEAARLFSPGWMDSSPEYVPSVLRAIGRGADI